jgi:hypothetical protein
VKPSRTGEHRNDVFKNCVEREVAETAPEATPGDFDLTLLKEFAEKELLSTKTEQTACWADVAEEIVGREMGADGEDELGG